LAQALAYSEKGLKHKTWEGFLPAQVDDTTLLLPGYFASSYAPVSLPENKSYFESKETRRGIKERIYQIAFVLALALGFGEAIVAAVGVSGLIFVVPLVVFVSGYYDNYILVLKDTYDTLKLLWDGKLFFDSEGNPVNGFFSKIAIVFFAIIFSFASGASYAALSANSLWPLAKIFFGYFLPTVVSPWVAGLLVGVIAIGTAVSFGAMFFVQVDKFIIDKKWKNAAKYLRREFWWDDDLSQDVGLGIERMKHWASNVMKFFKLAIALSLTGIITWISFGLFSGKMKDLFAAICDINFADKAARALAWGNAFVMSVFGISKNQANVDDVSAGNLLTAAVVLTAGIAALFIGAVEVILRCAAWRQECAPVVTGEGFGIFCERFKGLMDSLYERLPSCVKSRPTFCQFPPPDLAASSDSHVMSGRNERPRGSSEGSSDLERPRQCERLQQLTTSYARIQGQLAIRALGPWNSVGQTGLFLPYASVLRPALGGNALFAGLVGGASEFFYSFGPIFRELEQNRQDAEVSLPPPLHSNPQRPRV
jgi:hypothetical protein